MANWDCIFIPGGGLNPDGSLPPWTLSRLDEALNHQEQSHYFGLLSGGTVHKPPPLRTDGYPIFEARAAADFLIASGISSTRILTEICSYDTIGNAYFSRILFSQPLKFKRALVITSQFHMARTRAAFDWVYGLSPAADTPKLTYLAVPDQGLSPEALSARVQREEKSLQNLLETSKKITDLPSFFKWLYSEHKAYAPGQRVEGISDQELESY